MLNLIYFHPILVQEPRGATPNTKLLHKFCHLPYAFGSAEKGHYTGCYCSLPQNWAIIIAASYNLKSPVFDSLRPIKFLEHPILTLSATSQLKLLWGNHPPRLPETAGSCGPLADRWIHPTTPCLGLAGCVAGGEGDSCCCSGRRRLQMCQKEWTQRPALKGGSEESPGVRNCSEDPETEPLPVRGKPQGQKARLRPQASASSQIFPGRNLRWLSAPSPTQSTEASRKKARGARRADAQSPSAQA